ncbi:MAG: hypothetical protein ACFFDF_21095 [Candidatus Odinarchaeota archaeon]
MSLYWNNMLLRRFSNLDEKIIKFKLSTNIGRFYFYFEKEPNNENSSVNGKIVFFPKEVEIS